MPKVSIRVSEDLKKRMEEHSEINWSEIARNSFEERLNKIDLADKIASKSDLTKEDVQELSKKIKEGIAERHEL
ncbi:hypothetical protein C9439_02835 [archaeon SCG-AAA382B04]|nr:hypothetical protein C9439_02835 [archaeon SCG-AAA382B04]